MPALIQRTFSSLLLVGCLACSPEHPAGRPSRSDAAHRPERPHVALYSTDTNLLQLGPDATDARVLRDLLVAQAGPMGRGKFETTQAFDDRMKLHGAGLSGYGRNALVVVVTRAEMKYDADTQLAAFCPVPDGGASHCDGPDKEDAILFRRESVDGDLVYLSGDNSDIPAPKLDEEHFRTVLYGKSPFAGFRLHISASQAKVLDSEPMEFAYILSFANLRSRAVQLNMIMLDPEHPLPTNGDAIMGRIERTVVFVRGSRIILDRRPPWIAP